MGKGANWTDEEIKFLVECIEKGMDDRQISSEFHIKTKFEKRDGFHYRTIGAVDRKRRILLKSLTDEPVPKPTNHNKPWSQDDDTLLIHLDEMGMNSDAIAFELDRTESAIIARLHVLNNQESESIFTLFVKWFSDFTESISKFFFGSKEGGK
ncbi:hypothetical protein DSECCO2_565060 [anaerobic digester metagenome]